MALDLTSLTGEAVFVGIVLLAICYLVIYAMTSMLQDFMPNKLRMLCNKHTLTIALFLSGLFMHVIFEVTGYNMRCALRKLNSNAIPQSVQFSQYPSTPQNFIKGNSYYYKSR